MKRREEKRKEKKSGLEAVLVIAIIANMKESI